VSGRTIAGEVRLDNRAELLREIGVGPEQCFRMTDLALVLAAYERWGEVCTEKLLGDFAFVVHDDSTGRAFGARDHLGVKPFYYRAGSGGLAFSPRALSIPEADGLPLELDEARVADVCVPGLECVDRTSTFYRGVQRLPPGHRLSWQAGRVTVAPYWAPDPLEEMRLGNEADYVEAFREIFAGAVRCRLKGRAASMLSGGLDSSAIVGYARAVSHEDQGRPLTTLSAITDDPDCEESRHIRAVWSLPGLDPIAIRPEEVGSYRDEIEAYITSIDEPFDDAMMLPLLLYSAARRRGFDAVLDGVDGDTVASHEPDILAGLLRTFAWGRAWREARGFARFYRGTYDPWSSTARLLIANAGSAFAPEFVRARWRPFRRERDVRYALAESLVSGDLAAKIDIPGRLRSLWGERDLHPLRTARQRQAQEITHPQIVAALERYHRVAASQGIEARHPFFDKRVVEFCLGLPRAQKVTDGWSKLIVRRGTAGLLPDDVRWRRGRWVRLGGRFLAAVIAESGEFLASELSGDMAALAPYLDLAKVRALYERHRRGDVDAAERIWTAAVLSSWLRKTGSRLYDVRARANGQAALPCLPRAG
jgi:asparagine synthase (glutamine-hydrolysing)